MTRKPTKRSEAQQQWAVLKPSTMKQRALDMLYYEGGQTKEQIAARLGNSPNSARMLITIDLIGRHGIDIQRIGEVYYHPDNMPVVKSGDITATAAASI